MITKKIISMITLCSLTLVVGAQSAVTLTAGDFEITPGGKATLTIDSDIALGEYCSFQFDLLLPEGITMPYNMNPDEEEEQYGYYDEENEEWVPAFESGIKKSSHVIACSSIEGGYRFVCYNANFTAFKTGSKNVLTLQLQASNDVVNGAYRPTLGGTMYVAGRYTHVVPTVVPGIAIIKGSPLEAEYEFTMSDAGWGTLMIPFAANLPSGLNAYNCTNVNGNIVEITPSNTLLANTPYLLNGSEGKYKFIGVPEVESNEYTSGCLTGVHSPTAINHGYVLQQQDGITAFYRVETETPITVSTGHCFLNIKSDAKVIAIHGTTNIEYINGENDADNDIYDLFGRKINGIGNRGIYIKNNKKVFVK